MNAQLLQQIANPRPFKAPDPVEGLSNVQQLRNQVQAGQMNAIALQNAQQAQQDKAITRAEAARAHQILIDTQGPSGVDFEKALPRMAIEAPTLYPQFEEFARTSKKAAQEFASSQATQKKTEAETAASEYTLTQNRQREADFQSAYEAYLKEKGLPKNGLNEQKFRGIYADAATVKKSMEISPGATVIPPDQALPYTAPATPKAQTEFEETLADFMKHPELVTKYGPGPIGFDKYRQAQKLEQAAATKAAAQAQTSGSGGSDNIRDTAEGIINGSLPPPDLSSRPTQFSLALTGELKRRGFDLSTARRDWVAVQKHLATLNGAQQERLRQAIQFTAETIPQIEDAFQEWKKQAGVSGFKILNRANLAAMKQLTGPAGSAAHNLDALISDFTSELGTVYKGGNSSTDESLKLAAQNLSTEWNERTFTDAIARLKRSMAIRRNSIATSQPQGVSPNSPYQPQPPTTTPSTPARSNRPPLSSFER